MIAICSSLFINKLNKFDNKVKILTIIYIAYEVLYTLFDKYYVFNYKFLITGTIFYLLPYFLFFSYGYYYNKINMKNKRSIIYFLIVFILFSEILYYFYLKEHLYFPNFKYPPRIFYISYAILISTFLLEIVDILVKTLKFKYLREGISFIGRSTMWIYLWHIPIVIYFQNFKPNTNWLLKFLMIFILSSLVTFFQQIIIKEIFKRIKFKKETIKLIKVVLCS